MHCWKPSPLKALTKPKAQTWVDLFFLNNPEDVHQEENFQEAEVGCGLWVGAFTCFRGTQEEEPVPFWPEEFFDDCKGSLDMFSVLLCFLGTDQDPDHDEDGPEAFLCWAPFSSC